MAKHISVNQCYCGCSLRTGTLIILWIYLIIDVIWLIAFLGCNSNCWKNAYLVFGYFQFMGLLMNSAFIILALWGIRKKMPSLMIPYLFFASFIIQFGILSIPGLLSMASTYLSCNSECRSHRTEEYFPESQTAVIVGVISVVYIFILVLISYFAFIVYNYYKILCNETKVVSSDAATKTVQDWSGTCEVGGTFYEPLPSYRQENPTCPSTYECLSELSPQLPDKNK